jgi:hypothetical protein
LSGEGRNRMVVRFPCSSSSDGCPLSGDWCAVEESEIADHVRYETNAVGHVGLDPGLGGGNGLLGLLTGLPERDRDATIILQRWPAA